jgi:hypothetical protein
VGRSERRRPLGSTRRRWEDNIIDLQKVQWKLEMDSSGSSQGQVAGCCECRNELSGSLNRGNFLTSRIPVSFLGMTLSIELVR